MDAREEMTLKAVDELEHLKLALELSGMQVPDVVLPERHDVILRRMRFSYVDWGASGLRPILFLHGGGLTCRSWDVVCLALRNGYRCLALDQRGHGDSEWSPTMDYSWRAHLGDIEAFADLLGLERFILVGMSMGGINSIAYAGCHSDRLAGLVLVDVGPDVRFAGGRRIRDFVANTAEVESVDEFVERALAFNPLRDRRLLRRSLLYNLRQLPNGKWMRKNDVRHFHQMNEEELVAHARELWPEVERITCPTLVVRGALSDVFLDEDAEKLAGTLPDGRWVTVAGAGHTVQGDNPRGLLEAMRAFFQEIEV
ncbi:MAG: alpha/beta hydrolase [Chloroflexi bacterium]|nr:alpha/beta hydrolase [Chloroflexota bacterium]